MTRREVLLSCSVPALFASYVTHTASAAQPSITASDVWSRQTVPGQRTGAIYMTLTTDAPTRLIGAATPAAGKVELHRTQIQEGVMKMHAVDAIDVKPGAAVKLAPGGYHVMLIDLKNPLSAGDRIPLELRFDGASGKQTLNVVSIVRPLTAGEPEHRKMEPKR
jgi:copper(I)-binding protein